MINKALSGRVHSFQSLGTVDGPGVRFVVFLQGCPLRCGCCHNPDTWDIASGNEFSATEVVSKAKNFSEYFGKDGGITLSGGEPLLQPEFAYEIFSLCRKDGINTCLDTSGCILNDKVEQVLSVTDRVLLDIKYTEDEKYRKYVGCGISTVLDFLKYLDEKEIPTTVRQVIIPTLNDNKENILRLKDITEKFNCIDKVELLPFKKVCQVKYDNMKLQFPFSHIPEPKPDKIKELYDVFNIKSN